MHAVERVFVCLVFIMEFICKWRIYLFCLFEIIILYLCRMVREFGNLYSFAALLEIHPSVLKNGSNLTKANRRTCVPLGTVENKNDAI